ncbi:MAG: 2-C-methyl-D-erythritol 2,4-cyclodiphosphate synthase [Oscillospiraceae bacterium]|jgi:2-C-methyl-D-erythritol 2,4-cyclodiphosphate synthase|nr:2-C-methyl-D-erythritol 2,4-cyclodiphosphate synthase [Oscillospiraceae bacterium]
MRIGQGYDAHRLVPGRPLVLGGVTVPSEKGLLGHSDADVLTHAVIDALLGAACLGDLGALFPDHDPRFGNISSLTLLREAVQLVKDNGFTVINIDATVVAQRPALAPYREEMQRNLAACLGAGAVSVKFTTEEGMGFSGSGEGMAATAVCLIGSL